MNCPNNVTDNNLLPASTSREVVPPMNGQVPIKTKPPIESQLPIEGNPPVQNPKKKEYSFIYIILSAISLIALILALGSFLYLSKFKKKEDDPIPIFTVEESSYCYDGNTHSPPLGSASYNSGTLEKTLLDSNRSANGQPRYCHSPKATDHGRLSVQLTPINDGISHSSHTSNRSKNTAILSIQTSQNNDSNHKASTPESPNFTSLSPISAASTIPFIPNTKLKKTKSLRSERSGKKPHLTSSPYANAESPVILDKKVSNPYLLADSQSMVSDVRSKISDKHSFQSNRSGSEVEAKVLSSKHYVLSKFEGDDSKEELNLHYGDIVSVINILPDGWAYGELLLKYNSYENKSNQKMMSKPPKYRKFGYYPIKCLSPDEEGDDAVDEKKEDLPELKSLTSSFNVDNINNKTNNKNDTANNNNTTANNNNSSQNEKAPLPKTLNVKDNSTNNILFVHPRSTGKNFRKSSLLNMTKMDSKDALAYYNEPNSSSEKRNSKDFISDTESSTGTIYHDAEEEHTNFDAKRISVRSSLSYRSYI